jgi:hypothetical protein
MKERNKEDIAKAAVQQLQGTGGIFNHGWRGISNRGKPGKRNGWVHLMRGWRDYLKTCELASDAGITTLERGDLQPSLQTTRGF